MANTFFEKFPVQKLWEDKEKRYALLAGMVIFPALMLGSSLGLLVILCITVASMVLSYLIITVAQRISHFFNKLQETLEDADKVLKKTNEKIDPLAKELKETLKNVNEKIEPLSEKLSKTLDAVKETTEKLNKKIDPLSEKMEITLTNANEKILQHGGTTLTQTMRTLQSVDETLKSFRKILQDLQGATETVSTYTAPVSYLAKGFRGIGDYFTKEQEKAKELNTNEINKTNGTNESNATNEILETPRTPILTAK